MQEEQVCPVCGHRCENFIELVDHIRTFHKHELEKKSVETNLTEAFLKELQQQAKIKKAQEIKESYPLAPIATEQPTDDLTEPPRIIDLTETSEKREEVSKFRDFLCKIGIHKWPQIKYLSRWYAKRHCVFCGKEQLRQIR